MPQVKFICNAVKWFDKVNGNTYHSVRVTRCKDGKTIVPSTPYQYGYGDQYRQTALELMHKNGWLRNNKNWKFEKYPSGCTSLGEYDRLNNYPIQWNVSHGLKREMITNGTL
jgi:hypothetical protein